MRKFSIIPALFAGITTASFAASEPVVKPWGLYLSYVDTSVAPGDNFFAYGNGNWLKTAKIPGGRSYAGVNLELDLKNEEKLHAIIADLEQKAAPTPDEIKLRDLYRAFMDTAGIETHGLKPASADLATISAAKTPEDIARLMGRQELGLEGPFALNIGVDDKHPTQYSVNLSQSGLGMPDRDYYLRQDAELVAARDAYKKYLTNILELSGAENSSSRADAIYRLEYALATASWAAADRRDVDKIYNPVSFSELEKLAPGFPWRSFMTAAHVPLTAPRGERVFLVAEKSAFPKLAEIFSQTPVDVWKDYLTVRYLHSFAPYLPKAIDDADFAFYGKVLSGKTQQLDRATRGVSLLDGAMGEALGKLYAERYFPADAKAKALVLVNNLLKAYETDVETLDWMTPQTRAMALEKLHTFTPKIGYPDKWRDYSALHVERDNLLKSVQNAEDFEWNRVVKRIDLPVDKAEWGMTPPTNNAYYNPVFNEIVFPAGILQPPFFDPNADDAVNYGGIGATIGHEISHGFDDQGSKYDGAGVLRNWWTEADRKNFDARTAELVRQFNQYEPITGVHINGELTLGENIADLAGLVIAYKAYKLSLGGKPAPVLNGLTGDQRFYLAFAQSWRQKDRPDSLRVLLLSNPHSPAEYRVNGIVRNDDGWYAAFPQIKTGDRFYLPPAQRVKLW